MSFTFEVDKLQKKYLRKTIFTGLSFTLSMQDSLTITGRNGAGKSTLLKVLASLTAPTSGKVIAAFDGKAIDKHNLFRHIGFVAPYLQMYEEFTAWENLDLLRKIRNVAVTDERMDAMLHTVQLHARRHDVVKTYSSGMKQRLKYACALLHAPPLLMLDEPTANLDVAGRTMVQDIVAAQRAHSIVIVATNEPQEIAWCDQRIDLDGFNAN